MPSDHIRASDHDRDAVVTTLRDAYTEGRLTLEEFQERTATAYDGRTWGDLRELTTDLPVQPVLGSDLPPEAQPAGPQPMGAQPAGVLPPGVQPDGTQPPGAIPPGVPQPWGTQPWGTQPWGTQPWGTLPGVPPWAYPPGQVTGAPPAGVPLGHQPPAPYPPQAPPDARSRQPRQRPFAPVVPVVGMWILFALATRSAGGAVAFLIAVALLVTLASIGRRPPRGPSDQDRR
jgi:hypothetical protein